jgi:hypothetical protein
VGLIGAAVSASVQNFSDALISFFFIARCPQLSGKDILRCPSCNLGEMVRIREFGRGTSEVSIDGS